MALRWLNPLSMMIPASMAPMAATAPSHAEASYSKATEALDEVIELMRARAASKDPVRALMADIWLQRHNIPALTTIFEAAAEMKAATNQVPDGENDGAEDKP